MTIPKPQKPSTGALKWIAGLMGRMDRSLAQAIPALAAAMTPPAMPKCIPFHKRPGYVKRERISAGARRKQAAATRRAANATQPKFPAERVHKPHQFREDADGNSFTWTGRNTFIPGDMPWDKGEWVPGRRGWTAGVSSTTGEFA